MPIDKITPRQLDADSDGKLISKTSMLDALNLYLGEDDGGNRGVLKNIKGNSIVSVVGDMGDHFHRITGSVTDSRTGICYLFVFSKHPSYHSVWAYDPEGKLAGDGLEVFTLIYRSKQFNFNPQGFVKGDVVHINRQTFTDRGPEFEKDAVIYFTDGENEPRKINAYRAYQSGSNFQIHGADNIYAEADFITACPKTPVKPIEFTFKRDEFRQGSNFKVEPGFQFAYQNVYKDGFESAISCYSDIAFPPTIINQGSSPDVDHSLFNKCVLTIPAQGEEISKVKLVARRGNGPDFFVIDEIDVVPGQDTEYDFFNDRITKGISPSESIKQFDNLPRRAKAQSVASNRVLYGNYLDGYDNVETSCIASIKYADRPKDFQDFNIGYKPAITRNDHDSELEGGVYLNSYNKSTGFQLDFSSIPDSYSINDTIDISITVSPDKNWHIYRYERFKSYHSTAQLGATSQENPDGEMSGANADMEDGSLWNEQDSNEGGNFLVDNLRPVFGRSDGIHGDINSNLRWKTVAGNNSDQIVDCSFGTSGGNPLILKGGPVNFTCSFRFALDVNSGGKEIVRNAVRAILAFKYQDIFQSNPQDNYSRVTDIQLQAAYLDELGVEILSRKDQSELNIDLNLPNRLTVAQGRPNVPEDENDPLAKLIVAVKKNGPAVGDPSIQSTTAIPNENRIPVGFFAVEKANVLFDLEAFNVNDDPLLVNFIICVKQISNVELFTCMKGAPNGSVNTNLSWAWVRSSKLATVDSPYSYIADHWGTSFASSLDNAVDTGNGENLPDADVSLPQYNYTRQAGYLIFAEGFNSPQSFFANRVELNGDYLPTYSRFSLLDGEGGPGGGRQGSEGTNLDGNYDQASMYNIGSVNSNADPQVTSYPNIPYGWSGTVFYRGTISFYYYDDYGGGPDGTENGMTLPLLRWTSSGGGTYYTSATYVDHKRLHCFAEITTVLFFINRVNINDRSFKTSADHDFGIVYFDERGRHGFVNPLATVYVPGYSSFERPGPPGSVSIELKLDHDPPLWAHNYKIVYSKNTSVKEFVQYSAGGAFAKQIEGQQVSEANQNLYVSLNYLQEHPISYSTSFGARGIDGGLSIYKFSEGDKLRVISYDDGGERSYPFNYEFDIIDYRILSDDEDNPLSEEPAENQQGAFLVLRNNPFATSFSYTAVAAESSKWGHNCIVEIYSPYREADEEDRIYYETGETGRVVFIEDTLGNISPLQHLPSSILLDKGDVWFRKVPVNVREFSSGEYVDLIYDDEELLPEPTPNFKSVYLETMSANDTIPSNSHYIGRPNVYSESAGQVIRESSLTYSDATDPSSKKPKFSSFNLSKANFKDLSENYGDINYMSNFGEYLVVLQKDKISMVPLNRNILSDAAGGQNIIASREVLGDPVFLNEDDGSSSPESVVKVDSTLYFADSGTYRVFKMSKSPGGIITISDKGVASLIRREVKAKESEAGAVKLIGGYDPLKDEYLLTIISSEDIALTGPAEMATQPIIDITGTTDDEEDTPDDDLVNIVISDTDGDGIISTDEIIDQSGIDPAFVLEGDEEVITDIDGDGSIDINDFITGLVANGQNPIQILSAYIENTDDAASFSDSLVNNLIETNVIQPDDLSVAETSVNTDNLIDPETANVSELADLIIQKIQEFSEDSPENTLTVGDLNDILSTTSGVAQAHTLSSAFTQILSDLNRDNLVTTTDLVSFLNNFDTNLLDIDSDTPLITPLAT